MPKPKSESYEAEAARYGVTPQLYEAASEMLRLRRTQLLACDRCRGTRAVIVELLAALERAHAENARLRDRVRLRSRTIPAAVRRAVVERDGDRCRYCGKKIVGKGHFDHVIPAVAGGDESVENLVLACQPCNMRKGRWVLGSHKLRGMKLRPAPNASDS